MPNVQNKKSINGCRGLVGRLQLFVLRGGFANQDEIFLPMRFSYGHRFIVVEIKHEGGLNFSPLFGYLEFYEMPFLDEPFCFGVIVKIHKPIIIFLCFFYALKAVGSRFVLLKNVYLIDLILTINKTLL